MVVPASVLEGPTLKTRPSTDRKTRVRCPPTPAMRCPRVPVLPACAAYYAMPSTDTASVLCAYYALRGTDLAYGAMPVG
eukprot:773259-Rhodomonas_salina.1